MALHKHPPEIRAELKREFEKRTLNMGRKKKGSAHNSAHGTSHKK